MKCKFYDPAKNWTDKNQVIVIKPSFVEIKPFFNLALILSTGFFSMIQ